MAYCRIIMDEEFKMIGKVMKCIKRRCSKERNKYETIMDKMNKEQYLHPDTKIERKGPDMDRYASCVHNSCRNIYMELVKIWRVTNKKDIMDTRKMLRDMGKNMTTSEKKVGRTLLENYERTQKMLNEVWNNRDNIQLEDIKKLIFT